MTVLHPRTALGASILWVLVTLGSVEFLEPDKIKKLVQHQENSCWKASMDKVVAWHLQ